MTGLVEVTISDTQVIALELEKNYGLRGTLEPLASYADRNFKLSLSGGGQFVVKLSQAPGVDAEIDLMVALEDKDVFGLALPRHLVTRDGRRRTTVTLGREPWCLRVLTFIEGTVWAEAMAPSEAQLYATGERLARLDLLLHDQAWTQGPRHAWDLHEYRALLQHPGLVEIDAEMREILTQCVAYIAAREDGLPSQLIYNDANDYNLFLKSMRSEYPCGLVDFGDACHSFTVLELAVAGAYLTDRSPNRLEALKQLTLGYHAVRPLSKTELECLPRFILLRVLQSRLNYLKTVAAEGGNPYLAISQDQLLRQFRLFVTIGLDVITEELIAACDPGSASLLLVERRDRLVSRQVLRLAEGAREDLTIDRPFGALDDSLEGRIQPGVVFHAERDLVLSSVLDVTRFEQQKNRLLINLHAPDLGHLTLVFASGDADLPLPVATVEEGALRLSLSGGQKFLLTCLWGGGDLQGMRSARSFAEDSWRAVSGAYIDAALLLGCKAAYSGRNDVASLLHARRQLLSPTLSHAYTHPLKIMKGDMAYLVAEDGRRYLDLVNNVAHVGHSNPRVVAAGCWQMGELNTNTRYLHDTIVTYTEHLLDTLPDHLEVLFLVNSGSEANDLAMRLAHRHTKRRGFAVLEHAYHGHLSSMIGISPYKHDGPGGEGTPEHVLKLPFPDTYRGRHRGASAPQAYLDEALARLAAHSEPIAAFYAESFAGVGGQWIWPTAYIEGVVQAIQERGALYVADEVQVGFGRAGSSFWAFEQYDVTPDIVTMGKPIGNGHPVAAVATTRAVADSFLTGMEYFNTFGGNPVSCAIALAVLDEIQDNNLQQRARVLGAELKWRLEEMSRRYLKVGQVRGCGLFIGVEIISGPALEAEAKTAERICSYLRLNGVLLTTDGPDHNVLKIKPPMVLRVDDIGDFLGKLEAAFELYCK